MLKWKLVDNFDERKFILMDIGFEKIKITMESKLRRNITGITIEI